MHIILIRGTNLSKVLVSHDQGFYYYSTTVITICVRVSLSIYRLRVLGMDSRKQSNRNRDLLRRSDARVYIIAYHYHLTKRSIRCRPEELVMIQVEP